MRFEKLALSVHDHVAEIALTRPGDGNPVDDRFLAELEAACTALHDDAGVHVAVLSSEGVFSRGAGAVTRSERLPFRCLETMAQPVIAAIEGEAAGAGLELALACDIRVASAAAVFSMPQVGAGAAPSLGGTQRLPRVAGRAAAASMILLGDTLGADAALACGLINAIAPAGKARGHALALAARIAARGPIAVRYAKEAALRGLDMPLDAALRYETDLTVILQTTADRAEGVRAFIEKRPPAFEGR